MKLIERIESKERCAESGWYAYDYCLDEPMTAEFIRKLKPLGNFVYLSMLKNPFFKIENDYFFIKGVQGNCFFRVAVHDEHRDILERVESFINKLENDKV